MRVSYVVLASGGGHTPTGRVAALAMYAVKRTRKLYPHSVPIVPHDRAVLNAILEIKRPIPQHGALSDDGHWGLVRKA